MSPPTRTLVAEDFRKLARGPYMYDRWRSVPPLETQLGRFNVELSQRPDVQLLTVANELANYLAGNSEAVLAAVHASYSAASYDEGWMEDCQVPIGLTAADLREYLDHSKIAVRRSEAGDVSGVIYFNPRWDQEHGLYLQVVDGSVVRTDP